MTTAADAVAADSAVADEQDGNRSQIVDPAATQVSDQITGTDVEQPVDDVRAGIYAKHAEQRKAELGAATPPELDPEEQITVKVNGRERQVARSKIDAAGGIEAYQKNAAASEMLNQASAEARRVREQADALAIRERDIAEREQRLQQAAAEKPTPSTELPADAGALKSMARQYHDAMLDGDIDKADELLLQINAAQKTATAINPDEIAQRAVQRAREELTADQRREAAQRFEADRQAAVSEFSVKHKDLASNPDAFGMVDAKTLEVHREHPDWPAAAIIDEAATRVRNLIKSVSTPTTTSAKLDAKRSRTQINGGSARAAPLPGPVPQTRASYVSDLRKQRGLDV